MTDPFSPLRLRSSATLPNRLMLAPLTNGQSHPDGTLGEDELRWLVRRARGGFGLVSTCAAHVTADGQGFPGQLGVWGDHQLPGLTRLASALRDAGALPVTQLFHGGVRAPSSLTGVRPMSASEFTEEKPGFEVPRAATAEDVDRIVEAFVRAAERSAEAGFLGVEIHGAHGYLLGQFLSAVQNQRTDAWGQDRALLLRTVTRRIRRALPAPFVVGVRLSPEDFGNAKGLDLDDSVAVARGLAEDGVDYVHLSLWDVHRPTRKRPDQHPLDVFRPALPKDVALVAAGSVWTRDDAAMLLDRGADLVCVGRAAILDPDWPAHVLREGREPVRPPATAEQLAAVDVGPAFLDYLRGFRGLVTP